MIPEHAVVVTQQGLTDLLCSIRGVKSVTITEEGIGRVGIRVRYKFWTYLIPWCNRSVSRKVHAFIYNHKPFSISAEVRERRARNI